MRLLAGLSAFLLIAAPVQAQGWEPPNEVLQILAKGGGAWVVSCQWQDQKGKTVSREARGTDEGRWERIHVNRPASGTCSYKAAAGKPITILMKSPLYRCTLPTPGEGCEQTFSAGSAGQIEIRKRG